MKTKSNPSFGKLFLISGPSGVGKKTIISEIIKNPKLNLVLSTSYTSRSKRPGEVDGKDYFFITKEEFKNQIIIDNLVEYAEFFNNFYGTPKDFLLKTLQSGTNVLLEIEIMGFKQIVEKFPDLVSIFVLPPKFEALRERLKNRNSENDDDIEIRLEKARNEIKESDDFDFQIINNDLCTTISQVEDIIFNATKQ